MTHHANAKPGAGNCKNTRNLNIERMLLTFKKEERRIRYTYLYMFFFKIKYPRNISASLTLLNMREYAN